MIGKTILKYRSAKSNIGKKDISPKAIVLLLSIVMASFYSKDSFVQLAAASNSHSKVAVSKDIVPTSEKKMDSNGSEEIDDNENEDIDENAEDSVTTDSTDSSELDQVAEDQAPEDQNLADPEPEIQANAPSEPKPINEADSLAKETVLPPPEEPADEIKTKADYVEILPKEKTVELIPRIKYTNYRDRRTMNGFLLNINAENVHFPDYVSILDKTPYETLFGQEDLSMAQFQVGYKFNFLLGSIVGGVGYGSGTLIDDRSKEERSLTMNKKMAYAQWLLDSLMKEPYFVPYVGYNYWTMDITEKNKTKDTIANHETGNGTSITVGFLVQLNWLEPETAKMAYLNNGLENTYLDIFWTQYQGTDDDLDPNLENTFNFGVGLRVEF